MCVEEGCPSADSHVWQGEIPAACILSLVRWCAPLSHNLHIVCAQSLPQTLFVCTCLAVCGLPTRWHCSGLVACRCGKPCAWKPCGSTPAGEASKGCVRANNVLVQCFSMGQIARTATLWSYLCRCAIVHSAFICIRIAVQVASLLQNCALSAILSATQ